MHSSEEMTEEKKGFRGKKKIIAKEAAEAVPARGPLSGWWTRMFWKRKQREKKEKKKPSHGEMTTLN